MLAEYQATSIIDAAAKATLKAARTGAEKNKTKKHAREDGRLTRLRKAASLARDAARVRLIKQSKRCKCYPLPCQTNRSASLTSAKKKHHIFCDSLCCLRSEFRRISQAAAGKKLLSAPDEAGLG